MRTDSAFPQQYTRRILLAVCGLTPQVVTETLYVLAVKSAVPFLPTEVHIISTSEGVRRVHLQLLQPEPGWIDRLCSEYNIARPRFDASTIHPLAATNGDMIEDLRTEADHEAAANRIFQVMAELTEDRESAIHVSIAGGRKSMGFYAGYALSLLGRDQDRLSHVLVPPPFESHPDFFFPTKTARVIYSPPPDSRPLDTSQAEVFCAEIPFVRLRKFLPLNYARSFSFRDAVQAARSMLDAPDLAIDLPKRRLRAAGKTFELPPGDTAFLSWFATRTKAGDAPLMCPSEGAPEPTLAREFLAVYNQAARDSHSGDRTRAALRNGMEKAFFLERKSRLHRLLRVHLGPVHDEAYRIRALGRRPETRYDLGLEPSQIHFSKIEE